MEILINNNQDVLVDDELLLKVARTALAYEHVEDDVELSIALVDEDEIRGLNAHYRGKDSVTDVLSFETEEEEPGTSEYPHLLGDVVICPSAAARQAEEYGQTFEQEMALLLTHGILHLLGYDHQDDTEAKIMEGHEKEILADEK
ncbi:MAG: rRNA maturation RNase YbeY [Candidatus Aquicultor secundus]|uniref:Endoribonuclease YbeY n=1 Tax=Candidatus Aquicultor secundus TaxID=1973895 RepID=A0A2M7T9P8_9ACTN|nr:rRNA maturation RNase YbeY [Candidatus Aquicultor secundus]NCO65298.1 rRNA maturation RNase YbeY [Solirubrobacter sp.]OIO87211.1 MAG: rRNA maturation RNase YbeY [Candidatus Aquicultor secundus]PIU27814.1 MAG: rRNA maturation RNase YbeY [Candidatus Aquicultor secundus]PIW22306.1 MAG: rRNA maturation RNase YbeY [Candidatus Aquicultor secundus]PIX51737.1 MAG: rRNA maturation RNase YbeY [Candidatus Aquicultor secundus]